MENSNSKKYLSVIIPAYNAEKSLSATLHSLTNELEKTAHFIKSFTYEILVINDGSTDRTSEIVKQADLKNVILIEKPQNTGISDTRNYSIKYAEGKYIWYFDADDILFEDSVKPLIEYLLMNAPDLIYFGSVTQDQETKNIIDSFNNSYTSKILFDGLYKDYLYNNVCPSTCWITIVRRQLLIDEQIKCDTKLSSNEDLVWNLDIARTFPNIHFIKTDLNVVKYIVNPTSIINTINTKSNRRHLESFLYCHTILKKEKYKISFLNTSLNKYLPKLHRRIITRFLSCRESKSETRELIERIRPIVEEIKNPSALIKFYKLISKNYLLTVLIQVGYCYIFLPYIKPRLGRN